jgi:hypothetical protein
MNDLIIFMSFFFKYKKKLPKTKYQNYILKLFIDNFIVQININWDIWYGDEKPFPKPIKQKNLKHSN